MRWTRHSPERACVPPMCPPGPAAATCPTRWCGAAQWQPPVNGRLLSHGHGHPRFGGVACCTACGGPRQVVRRKVALRAARPQSQDAHVAAASNPPAGTTRSLYRASPDTPAGQPTERLSRVRRRASRPVGRVLCTSQSWPTAIHLGLPLLTASCGLPASIGRAALNCSRSLPHGANAVKNPF